MIHALLLFPCRNTISGNPTYCNYCGKSYGVKLCGREYINIRVGEAYTPNAGSWVSAEVRPIFPLYCGMA